MSTINLVAQSSSLKHAISAKALLIDYYTPQKKQFSSWSQLNYGAEVAYNYNLNRFLNLNIPLKIRSANLPEGDDFSMNQKFIGGLDANLQLKYFKEKNWINPYMLAGLGGEIIESEGINFGIPLGLGIDVKLSKRLYLQAQSEYRFSFTNNRDNLIHGIGLILLFGEEKLPLSPVDTDGDGISDMEDGCPQQPGLASLNGCPDTDLDGVIDKADKCPNVAGLKEFDGCPDTDSDGLTDDIDQCPDEYGPIENNGCPILDTDGDGVNDEVDDCPDEPGLAENNGCPDTDEDGILDKYDKCPTQAGLATNKGCPEISQEDRDLLDFAVQNVQFANGKSTLISESFSILDKIVEIMIKYPAYSLTIAGHTDSVGNAEFNQILSERRAKTCKDYLISKGIEEARIDARGYGETQPIANNKFDSGRDLNRRVEFNIYLK